MKIVFAVLAAFCALSSVSFAQVRLNAAVVPNYRTALEGETVTFFSTVINSGDAAARNCRVVPRDSNYHGTDMDYQRTDAANQPIGTVNTPFDIPAGGSQSLVLAIRPTGPLGGTYYRMDWVCDEAQTGAQIGISAPNIRLQSAGSQIEDVIMILVTPSQDGVARMVENGRRAVAAGSALNIGDPGSVEFFGEYPVPSGARFESDIHLRGLTICMTDSNGQCLADPGVTVTDDNFETGEIHTFTLFLDDQADTIIPLFADINRVFLQARQSQLYIPVGSTSVAVSDDTASVDVIDTPTIHSWRYFVTNPDTGFVEAYTVRITSDGYFHAFRTETLSRKSSLDRQDFLFGQVNVQRNGNDLSLTGSVDRFHGGQAVQSVDVSELRLTLGGRVRGNISDLNHTRIRGFYAAGHDTPDMQPAREGGSNIDRWTLSVLDDRIDGSLTGAANLRDDEFRFNSLIFLNSERLPFTNCDTDLLLEPRTDANEQPTGSYNVTGSLACGASASDFDGNYVGTGVIEAVYGGGACYVLMVLQNTSNQRIVPFHIFRGESPTCTPYNTFR